MAIMGSVSVGVLGPDREISTVLGRLVGGETMLFSPEQRDAVAEAIARAESLPNLIVLDGR
jgi:hypothetical protein